MTLGRGGEYFTSGEVFAGAGLDCLSFFSSVGGAEPIVPIFRRV